MPTENKLKKVFWPAAIVLSVLYLIITLGGPAWVEAQHTAGQFGMLNSLTGVSDHFPVDFYQGEIEKRVTGPVRMILSGLVLTGFACLYLTGINHYVFAAVIFIYYLLTRPEVIGYPLFGEQMTAPFYDVVWLVRNGMDYAALHRQETFTTGGPLVYPTSLWTLATAWLMKVSPSVDVFLKVMHVLYFGLAAGTIAAARAIYGRFFTPVFSVLGAVLLLVLPVNQAMAELLNMELPCMFFAALAMYALISRKFVCAAFWSIIALFMKSPAGAVTMTVAAAGLLAFFVSDNKREKWEGLICAAFVSLVTIIKFKIRAAIIGAQTPNNTIEPLIGWTVLIKMPVTWIFIATVVLSITILARSNKGKHLRSVCNEHFGVICLFMMTGLWFALYLNFSVMAPRYKPLMIPYLMFCIYFPLYHVIKSDAVRIGSMVTAIIIALSCSYGWHHTRYVPTGPYGYNWLERSLEYRNKLRLQMKIADVIAREYPEKVIGAPHVTAQSLAIPEMGYITEPQDVMVYGTRGILGVRNLVKIDSQISYNTLWVGFTSPWFSGTNLIDPQNDMIIKDLWYGDRHAVLFYGGHSIEHWRQEIEATAERIKKARTDRQ